MSPGTRAVLRWAWRLFRLAWRQQLLVLVLVTLVTGTGVAIAAIATNTASGPEHRLGNATASAALDPSDPAAVQRTLAALADRFGTTEIVVHRPVAVAGAVDRLDLRTQDPNGVFGKPTLGLRSGRYPIGADEVAVTDGAAKLLRAKVGGRVLLDRRERTVVGVVENPRDLRDEFALSSTGDPTPPGQLIVLLDRNASGPQTGGFGSTPPINVEGGAAGAVAAIVLVATTLAMALVGLVATAAFVVAAQRRQRQLGLLAALGATPRQVRVVVLANGVIVGLVAAAGGGALGLLGWLAAAPAVEAAAAHRIDRLDLPVGLIAATLGLALLASTGAAWWPARTIARVPVVTALSLRPLPSARRRGSLVAAVGILAAGLLGIAWGLPADDRPNAVPLVAGFVATIVGVVLLAPVAVRSLEPLARRLPFAPRLALRDLVRHQARAAAAVAATTLALAIAVTTVVIAQANTHGPDEGNLPTDQLVLHVDGLPQDTSPHGAATRDALARRIAADLGAEVFPLQLALPAAQAGRAGEREPVSVAKPIPGGLTLLRMPVVATPELLRWNGIDPATIPPTAELLTTVPGDAILADVSTRFDEHAALAFTVHRAGPQFTASPTSLITPAAMQRHGWTTVDTGWFLDAKGPITPVRLAAARDRAASGGLAVEARDREDGLATLRSIATAAGAALALAILAMAIGLIRAESAREVRTIDECGARRRTLRGVTAATAGALACLSVVLAVGGAYLALVSAYRSDLGALVPVPVVQLIELLVGLPALAVAGGWLLGGRASASGAAGA